MNRNQIIWEIKDLQEQAEAWRKEALEKWRPEEYRRDAIQIFYRFQERIDHKKLYLQRELARKEKLKKLLAD